MARVGDFRVINDLKRKLGPGEKFEFPCEIPPNLSHGGEQPKSVVHVKFKLEGASGLSWELYLNGSQLLVTSGSGSGLITTMEAFDANLLLKGPNLFEVRVTRGGGAVWIEDMVVHFHIDLG